MGCGRDIDTAHFRIYDRVSDKRIQIINMNPTDSLSSATHTTSKPQSGEPPHLWEGSTGNTENKASPENDLAHSQAGALSAALFPCLTYFGS